METLWSRLVNIFHWLPSLSLPMTLAGDALVSEAIEDNVTLGFDCSGWRHIELACLRWSAEGKTMTEIADILEMSYSGVRHHVEEAKSKLGAVNIKQATAAATRLRLI